MIYGLGAAFALKDTVVFLRERPWAKVETTNAERSSFPKVIFVLESVYILRKTCLFFLIKINVY